MVIKRCPSGEKFFEGCTLPGGVEYDAIDIHRRLQNNAWKTTLGLGASRGVGSGSPRSSKKVKCYFKIEKGDLANHIVNWFHFMSF